MTSPNPTVDSVFSDAPDALEPGAPEFGGYESAFVEDAASQDIVEKPAGGFNKILLLAGAIGAIALAGTGFAIYNKINKSAGQSGQYASITEVRSSPQLDRPTLGAIDVKPSGDISLFSSTETVSITKPALASTTTASTAPAVSVTASVQPQVAAMSAPATATIAQSKTSIFNQAPSQATPVTQAKASSDVATASIGEVKSKPISAKPVRVARTPKKVQVARAQKADFRKTKVAKRRPANAIAASDSLKTGEQLVASERLRSARVLAFWPQTGDDAQAWIALSVSSQEQRFAVREGDQVLGMRVLKVSPSTGEVKLSGATISLR